MCCMTYAEGHGAAKPETKNEGNARRFPTSLRGIHSVMTQSLLGCAFPRPADFPVTEY